jgi:hypothetical protein
MHLELHLVVYCVVRALAQPRIDYTELSELAAAAMFIGIKLLVRCG